ncbi:UvrABC system protein C [Spirochaeta thermophila DSM 6578]|uniref:UvrABC system protein C n=1 Tax=Winmispira thermophila (strain ATCC 700085 / DSM 6578 / Z-1203) TaxID=869211 RepID=G0GG28_WINT7|nr:excinuclease ABC subunit UvrC [Spirochaeta thermophila]AEJ62504.1 UvrABC system protein C [Spirochaeta thermophila DSM 6578]
MDGESYKGFGDILRQVEAAPSSPGVYLMRDEEGKVIYVGKAKVLRNRLRSYISGTKDRKTTHLMRRVRSIEWIVTDTEYDALLLENTLIKKYQPKYNIDLKDGKSYPVIRLTAEDFPRVFRTRKIVHDGSRYFGPYGNAHLLDLYLDFIDRFFPLRKCRGPLRKRAHPCLYYHIGRCPAPCVDKISREDYLARVEDVARLLSGEVEDLQTSLKGRMEEAASRLAYETAARYRDALQAVEEILKNEQKVVDFAREKRDYAAYVREEPYACFVVFKMRDGKLVGRDAYVTHAFDEDDEDFSNFLVRYYDADIALPEELHLFQGTQEEILAPYLAGKFGIRLIREGEGHPILNLVVQNAREELARHLKIKGNPEAVLALQEALELPVPPVRIEGFDIAHLQGTFPYASMVQFLGGVPHKSEYRLFRVKTLQGLVDDYEALREVTARRYTRLKNERKPLPDLILIDGGKGQVNAVREVLDALGLSHIPLVGLAKQREEIFFPHASAPLLLEERSPALRLLQYVRDEAHRFATTAHARARAVKIDGSILETVEGIGKKRAVRLLTHYGSLDAIARAEAEEIKEVAGCPEHVALRVKEALLRLVEQRGDAVRSDGA